MTDASGQRQRAEANCHQCGMVCQPNEYHPHAACVLYGATHDGAAVRANLNAIGQHARQEVLREEEHALGCLVLFVGFDWFCTPNLVVKCGFELDRAKGTQAYHISI